MVVVIGKGLKSTETNMIEKGDKENPQFVNRAARSDKETPQIPNRTFKRDKEAPQIPNRASKRDKEAPQISNSSMKSDRQYAQIPNRAAKSDKATASSVGPKKTPSNEPNGQIKTPTINTAAPTAGAANSAKDKIKRQLQGTNPDKKAGDKSRQAGRTAKQVVHGGAKRGMTFQEVTRRNRSDEYLKERMRPKKNLLDLFKKKR